MSDYCSTVLCPHWALLTFGDTSNPWSLIVYEWYLALIRRGWTPPAFATVMYDSSDGTSQKPSRNCYLLRVICDTPIAYRVVSIRPSERRWLPTRESLIMTHIFVRYLGVVSKLTDPALDGGNAS